MAIKLKSSNGENKITKTNGKTNWIITLIIVTLLGILSVGMCLSYPIIEKNAQNYDENYSVFNNNNLTEEIKTTNYAIYYDFLEKKANDAGEELVPADSFFTLKRENYSKNDGYYEEAKKEDRIILNDYVNSMILNLNNLVNLKVYALDENGDLVYTNEKNPWLLEGIAKNYSVGNSDISSKYSFCVTLKYDDRGKLTIGDIYGEDEYKVKQALSSSRNSYIERHNYLNNEYEAKPIENMTFVYAVPNKLQAGDELYYSELNRSGYAVRDASVPFILIGLAVAALLALIMPFKYTKDTLWFKHLLKMPLEIYLIIASCAIPLIAESGSLIIEPTINGDILNILKNANMWYLDSIEYILNILFWIFIYGGIFFGVTYIKNIFDMGFKKYLKEQVLVYRFKEVIFAGIRKISRYIKGIDLNKKSDKVLVILLGINFVIVSILCSVWFFGIFGVILYSAVLFYFARKYVNKWKNDYNKLLEKTKEIANGNLDSKTDEDCGFFNPMRDELNNIQKGFKAAVQEEVKSQRMKTELISNVSHDLKTPLTSIIAYVDLLKGEEDEEKRKDYLDTLDKKSQRLKYLIEDLFEVSKATSGNVSLNIMNVDISYLMKQAIIELDDKISEAGLDIRLSMPDHKVILPLDSQRTYRVFENLIINVVKYALPNSRVYVELQDKENDVEVTIKNISADEITFNVNEISDRFVRGDKSRNTEGSGLGLAIVKSFVELQGGKFNIEVDGDLFKAIINFKKN
ncbi:HAMP domain-containing histidine kinase [Clostridium perfringens]|nr:HAMP domain-containing histidine kinase [Clostridium perfringens]ELC8444144.1 HAMP domain-containing histidine kinase [Clostridium perfringens]